jgi:hypothetical protein
VNPTHHVDQPRATERAADDHTLGCGQPPPAVTTGRICARLGAQLSCQLRPDSPTYWRKADAMSQTVVRSAVA